MAGRCVATMCSHSRPSIDSKQPRRAQLPYRLRRAFYVRGRLSCSSGSDEDSRAVSDLGGGLGGDPGELDPEDPNPRDADDGNHGPGSRWTAPTNGREALAGTQGQLAEASELPLDAARGDPVRIAGGAAVAVLLVAFGGLLASVGVQWMMDEWTGGDGENNMFVP